MVGFTATCGLPANSCASAGSRVYGVEVLDHDVRRPRHDPHGCATPMAIVAGPDRPNAPAPAASSVPCRHSPDPVSAIGQPLRDFMLNAKTGLKKRTDGTNREVGILNQRSLFLQELPVESVIIQ